MKKALIISTASALLGLSSAYAMKPSYYVGAGVGLANNDLSVGGEGHGEASSNVLDIEAGLQLELKHDMAVSAGLFFGMNDMRVGGDILSVRTPYNFGLVTRIGKMFESSQAYVILGVGAFESKVKDATDKDTSMNMFARVGVGYEHAVSHNTKVYAEYSYDIGFNEHKIEDRTFRVQSSALKVGARYFFHGK